MSTNPIIFDFQFNFDKISHSHIKKRKERFFLKKKFKFKDIISIYSKNIANNIDNIVDIIMFLTNRKTVDIYNNLEEYMGECSLIIEKQLPWIKTETRDPKEEIELIKQ